WQRPERKRERLLLHAPPRCRGLEDHSLLRPAALYVAGARPRGAVCNRRPDARTFGPVQRAATLASPPGRRKEPELHGRARPRRDGVSRVAALVALRGTGAAAHGSLSLRDSRPARARAEEGRVGN